MPQIPRKFEAFEVRTLVLSCRELVAVEKWEETDDALGMLQGSHLPSSNWESLLPLSPNSVSAPLAFQVLDARLKSCDGDLLFQVAFPDFNPPGCESP